MPCQFPKIAACWSCACADDSVARHESPRLALAIRARWQPETTFSHSTENRRDERHTSDGLSRQPWRWQSRLARRFSLAEPARPLSGAACSIGTTGITSITGTHGIPYPGGAPQPDPIRCFILTVADVARRVATGFGYPGQVTASRADATDDLALLTIVSFYSSFP